MTYQDAIVMQKSLQLINYSTYSVCLPEYYLKSIVIYHKVLLQLLIKLKKEYKAARIKLCNLKIAHNTNFIRMEFLDKQFQNQRFSLGGL